jgi:carnitine O-acetyltransferase
MVSLTQEGEKQVEHEVDYEAENQAKASFDDVYTAPTPHDYIATMAKNGYEIGEQARPYCIAAAELLKEHNNDAWPVQMLDIGCSYGMGSAFVKYGCSFDEMVAFFSTRAPRNYHAAFETVRAWVNVTPTPYDVRCVGLDSSRPAILFAMRAGLLDGGIARDFENSEVTPNAEERSWLRSCNLLISTGAIGYVTDRTMAHVVRHAGEDHPGDFGPLSILTILRMFDSTPIRDVFELYGFRFDKVPGVMLPQRKFADKKEQDRVVQILRDKGLDTGTWEERGKQYSELFIAAKPDHFPDLLETMLETRLTQANSQPERLTYIYR